MSSDTLYEKVVGVKAGLDLLRTEISECNAEWHERNRGDRGNKQDRRKAARPSGTDKQKLSGRPNERIRAGYVGNRRNGT